jgi:cytidine deaminase
MLNELISKALEIKERAYAPYSKYRVGAAAMTADGRIFTGVNIENASYGLTVCAERVALFKGVTEGYTNFVALAVSVDTEAPGSPCGACRQVLTEFMEQDASVYLVNHKGEGTEVTVAQLLPGAFSGKSLKCVGQSICKGQAHSK